MSEMHRITGMVDGHEIAFEINDETYRALVGPLPAGLHVEVVSAGPDPGPPLAVGDVLGADDDGHAGFCGGMFGRDSYGPKTVLAIGRDWVVAREQDPRGRVVLCRYGPETVVQYRVK